MSPNCGGPSTIRRIETAHLHASPTTRQRRPRRSESSTEPPLPFAALKHESFGKRVGDLDWRVWLGLVLTFGWLILGYIYVETTVGWERFRHLPVDSVGNFLQGAFAPVA